MSSDDHDRFGELFVKFLASFDAFNETVGKEVDEILESRIETQVDQVIDGAVESAVEKAVDIAVESQVEDAMSEYENRIVELEGFVKDFDDPEEEIKRLHARIDGLVGKLDKLTGRIATLEKVSKAKWWQKSWWIFPL